MTLETADATGPEIGVSNHVVKVIEIQAESPHSWEDAARVALREASRTLHNITSMYVEDMQAVVLDGHVSAWRVNTKVSFIVDDPAIGGTTMRYRQQQDNVREGNYRPSRSESSSPDYDEYGLHGDDRRQYRGRESYEQQTRGGEGGRSGMFPQRYVPRDQDEPYRNNADEDQRGYRDISRRYEFESGGRRREYEGPWRGRNDEPRYGFDPQDYHQDYARQDRDRWQGQGGYYRESSDDYSRTDYGARDYSERDYSAREREAREPRRYGHPERHSPRGSYYGENRNWVRGGEPTFDQGRYASTQYDAYSSGQRRTGRGPKGYKRSDDRIREDVCDRLSHQYDVDASDVEVNVSNGEVTLSGTVSDRDQKFRIEHIADGVGGVNEVHNEIRVRREIPIQSASSSQTSASTKNPSNQTRSS